MKRIFLKAHKIQEKDLLNRGVLFSDFDMVISEPCVLVDEDTREEIALYDYVTHETPVFEALKRIKYQENTRTNGLKTRSRIFGFRPRIALRNDYCSITSLAREFPRENSIVSQLVWKAEELYKQHFPAAYKNHKETTEREVLPEYRIDGSIFTSGIINQDNTLNYHFDSGNFRGVKSFMFVFKKDVKGGYLVFPKYRVALECDHETIALFDGQSILHGVSAFYPVKRGGKRFTIVFYSLLDMRHCLPHAEEIKRIRAVKTKRNNKILNESKESRG